MKTLISVELKRILLAPLCLIVTVLMVMSPVINVDDIGKQPTQLLPETTLHENKEISEAQKQNISEQYGKLPLSFEINRGQTEPQVEFNPLDQVSSEHTNYFGGRSKDKGVRMPMDTFETNSVAQVFTPKSPAGDSSKIGMPAQVRKLMEEKRYEIIASQPTLVPVH